MTHYSYSVQKDGYAFGYLHENDIIHSINGELVTTPKQFVSAMKSATAPLIHVVIARMATFAFTNVVSPAMTPDSCHQRNTRIKSPAMSPVSVAAAISQMSAVDTQINLLNMSISPKQRKSIDKPLLGLVQDTSTQKSPISNAQVEF